MNQLALFCRRSLAIGLATSVLAGAGLARADALTTLRTFVKEVQSGQGSFTQQVTSPDGKRTRTSAGTLEFQRPNRFRFAYTRPAEQLIVGDGRQVWLWDADLNQVTVRPMSQALGATPAALLSGGSLDKDFELRNAPAPTGSKPEPGMEWVEATPRTPDGQFRHVYVGFKAGGLAALEVEDGFGQRSRMDFTRFDARAPVPASHFVFTPPPGADVLKQP